jgi:hypothetical protein
MTSRMNASSVTPSNYRNRLGVSSHCSALFFPVTVRCCEPTRMIHFLKVQVDDQ